MSTALSDGVDRTSIGSVKHRIAQFDPNQRAQPRTFLQKMDDKLDALPTSVKVGFVVGSLSFITYAIFGLAVVEYDFCLRDLNYGRDVSEFCRAFLDSVNWCKAQDWCQPLSQLIERLN